MKPIIKKRSRLRWIKFMRFLKQQNSLFYFRKCVNEAGLLNAYIQNFSISLGETKTFLPMVLRNNEVKMCLIMDSKV